MIWSATPSIGSWITNAGLNALRAELQQAIAAENFEHAAQLRDQIHGMEKEGINHNPPLRRMTRGWLEKTNFKEVN